MSMDVPGDMPVLLLVDVFVVSPTSIHHTSKLAATYNRVQVTFSAELRMMRPSP